MHISLNLEEQEHFLSLLGKRSIKNRTIVLNAGETCHSIYFVTKGCLRIYYTDTDGEEQTVSFLAGY